MPTWTSDAGGVVICIRDLLVHDLLASGVEISSMDEDSVCTRQIPNEVIFGS